MANGDSAATALIARLTLLMLNLALLGLGIALCVMGSNEDGTAGLVKAIYAEGGLTMSAFQKPDAALAVSGAFITLTSLQVRAHARPRIPTGASRPRAPKHTPPLSGSGAGSRAQFQLGANNRSSPVSRTPRAASDPAPARSAPSSRTTPCVSSSSPVSSSARR